VEAVVAKNAIKHGLLSQEVVIEGEDREGFEAFRESLMADLAPAGELEVVLADRIVAAVWRLRRLGRIEREMLEADYGEEPEYGAKRPEQERYRTLGRLVAQDLAEYDTYGKFQRYEAFIERALYKALHELQRCRAARAGHPGAVPLAFDVDVTGLVGPGGGDGG